MISSARLPYFVRNLILKRKNIGIASNITQVCFSTCTFPKASFILSSTILKALSLLSGPQPCSKEVCWLNFNGGGELNNTQPSHMPDQLYCCLRLLFMC